MTARKRSGQEAPAAGSLARPLHGGYWAVRPATDDGPEYFPHTLPGMHTALQRASHLAFSPLQEVISASPGSAPAVRWRFEHGACTLRPAAITPAGGAPRGNAG